MSIRYSSTLGRDLLYLAVPLVHRGKVVGVLRLSVALGHIDELLKVLAGRMVLATTAILALSLAMAALFSHLVSKPIRELARASLRVASGDLSTRVPPAANDEIRDLTEAFNDMARRLEVSFRELTERKEELETIVSAMNEALFVLDDRGRVTLHNVQAGRLSPAASIMGRYFWEVFRSPSLNELLDKEKEEALTGEVELQGKTYLCSAVRISSRNERVVTLYDITHMKEMERFKRDLAINVSHELKTPLTAIKGFTETCMEDAQGDMLEHLRVILRHTNRLIAMVNDLLTLSSMEERPTIVREEVRLLDVLKGILAVYEPRIKAKGLELALNVEDIVMSADPTLMEQLLINLVDNALRYTEKGSITIGAKREGGSVVLWVQDTGIGISREHLDKIFERFYVVDRSRSRATGGTGLGLSIVREIAEGNGGEVSLWSAVGSGSTFTLKLPAVRQEGAPS